MGYLKIQNLYKNQTILMFKECYAMEKVDGTSTHIKWEGNRLTFFSGGAPHEQFLSLWDQESLKAKFVEHFGETAVTIYGEGYGGKVQGMSQTYGKELKFIAFDVTVANKWLDVPDAEGVCKLFAIEFVPYTITSTDLAALDALRDAPSEVAVRRGITEPRIKEGIVLRPLTEFYCRVGERVITKHKRAEFMERKKQPSVVDADKQKILDDAEEIADEWVTYRRLEHVLDKLGNPSDLSAIGKVLAAMVDDVLIEGKDEFVESKEVRRAISKKCAELYKAKITRVQDGTRE